MISREPLELLWLPPFLLESFRGTGVSMRIQDLLEPHPVSFFLRSPSPSASFSGVTKAEIKLNWTLAIKTAIQDLSESPQNFIPLDDIINWIETNTVGYPNIVKQCVVSETLDEEHFELLQTGDMVSCRLAQKAQRNLSRIVTRTPYFSDQVVAAELNHKGELYQVCFRTDL